MLERANLPRVKLCAGWVTAGAFRAAGLDPAEYPRTLQPLSGGVVFDLGDDDAPQRSTRTAAPVCYGIIRSEFDEFLARRAEAAGATLRDGCALVSMRVADATSLPHQDDTRHPDGEGGFGYGTLLLLTDGHGQVESYGWFGTNSLGVIVTNVVFGRVSR